MRVTREAQKGEAIERMKILQLHPNTIEEFKDDDTLNASFHGILYFLTDEQKERVREFEEASGGVVYHVIQTFTEFGEMLSFLYVSKYPEEWGCDRMDLELDEPMVYVANVTDENCSEYGHIGIREFAGGVLRVY